ncbi:MAG: hydroxyacid dehydrogenase [Hyphomicrobiaceae bacterium]
MTDTLKTILRFDHWIHPEMTARFSRAPDVELVTLNQADTEASWLAFGAAHAYQISSARDELLEQWWATETLLNRAPHLLCVSASGAGYDTIDVDACTNHGVIVVNQAGGNARSVAEHTLGLILDLSKRISETDRYLREARGRNREDLMGREIAGRTLGLIGFGNVGRQVCRLARAFEMRVIATDPFVDSTAISKLGGEKVTLEHLLSHADFVSVHCPRDQSTTGLIGAEALAKMKRGAILITTARGGIHDEFALAAALESGHLGGAGLDVWDVEPPPLDHPLLGRENVVATFHTAGVTQEARRRMARIASDQLIEVLQGKRPSRLINPEVWPRYWERYTQIMGN